MIFHAWTFNGTVPGPTMRFTQGDHVQIKVINAKDSQFPHSLRVHSLRVVSLIGVPPSFVILIPKNQSAGLVTLKLGEKIN